ncbi:glycoside hydrolase domain-containing protein [Sphingomonas sp.]|uniref:glycoside hydrolase domain-containing protein n=1 Tax=Sphingomonas sp. TaxID=28214 RepID=UPI003F7E585E
MELATNGAMGFDTAVPLTNAQIASFVAQGYSFCVRYVSRTDASRQANHDNGTADLSAAEAKLIVDGGLALMVVQHVARHGWVPSGDLGTSYGGNAAAYCRAAALPSGITTWLDLEDLPQDVDHEAVVAYCNAWFDQVAGAGYEPGIYIGFNVRLSADDLFFRLKTRHYWRAAGNITPVSHRGYQMFQHVIKPDGKHELDQNVIKADAMGGLPHWIVA